MGIWIGANTLGMTTMDCPGDFLLVLPHTTREFPPEWKLELLHLWARDAIPFQCFLVCSKFLSEFFFFCLRRCICANLEWGDWLSTVGWFLRTLLGQLYYESNFAIYFVSCLCRRVRLRVPWQGKNLGVWNIAHHTLCGTGFRMLQFFFLIICVLKRILRVELALSLQFHVKANTSLNTSIDGILPCLCCHLGGFELFPFFFFFGFSYTLCCLHNLSMVDIVLVWVISNWYWALWSWSLVQG